MRIGIIGGGQLGMMMASAANTLGHEIISYDPQDNCCIIPYSIKHYSSSFDDFASLNKFCSECDIVTYEFENIPYNVIKELSKLHKVFPNYKALEYSQNRCIEKEFARSCGVETADFYSVKKGKELELKFDKCILKTSSGGYDGKGQIVLGDVVTKEALELVANYDCVVEKYIEFDYEISVIVSRSRDGSITTFPIAKNTHENGILFKSVAGDVIDSKLENSAISGAINIANKLDLYGTLAVEYFVAESTVIFNEMAPRPHNSGHYTIEGCDVSQFTQHINAITCKKLENPRLINKSVMINILGQDLEKALKISEGYLHIYNKGEARYNRKMGHITFTSDSLEKLNTIIGKYFEVDYE